MDMDVQTFHKIERSVRRYARFYKLSEVDIDDLTQEVFVRVIKYGGTKYLKRITRLSSIELYRRSQAYKAKRKNLSVVRLNDYSIDRLSMRSCESNEIMRKDILEAVEDEFGRDVRTMTQLKFDGLTVCQIAQQLNEYTVRQIRSRLDKVINMIDKKFF